MQKSPLGIFLIHVFAFAFLASLMFMFIDLSYQVEQQRRIGMSTTAHPARRTAPAKGRQVPLVRLKWVAPGIFKGNLGYAQPGQKPSFIGLLFFKFVAESVANWFQTFSPVDRIA